MKTTFDLPDTLVRRAKALAAQQGRPLRELVAEAIDRSLVAAGSEAAGAAASGEGRRQAWERFKARLEWRADGSCVNPDGVDESFLRSLDAIRREPWGTRAAFGEPLDEVPGESVAEPFSEE